MLMTNENARLRGQDRIPGTSLRVKQMKRRDVRLATLG